MRTVTGRAKADSAMTACAAYSRRTKQALYAYSVLRLFALFCSNTVCNVEGPAGSRRHAATPSYRDSLLNALCGSWRDEKFTLAAFSADAFRIDTLQDTVRYASQTRNSCSCSYAYTEPISLGGSSNPTAASTAFTTAAMPALAPLAAAYVACSPASVAAAAAAPGFTRYCTAVLKNTKSAAGR